jgi:primosomal protein N' (replication factor Y)
VTRVAVAIDAPQYAGMSSLLTYESERSLVPGTLARVPLGRREVTGMVWDTDFSAVDAAAAGPSLDGAERPALVLRPVIEAMDSLPPLPADWRALVEFTARYYQRSLGEVALAVLPPELRKLDNTAIAKRIKKKRDHLLPEASGASAQRPLLTPEQASAMDTLAAWAAAP